MPTATPTAPPPAAPPTAYAAPRLQRYFDEYASFHQNLMNQATHFIGIPMITFALLGLLSKVVLWPVMARPLPGDAAKRLGPDFGGAA